jgi:hypothetical protein
MLSMRRPQNACLENMEGTMPTKNVFRSLTLATLAALAATIWVAEASALTLVSSCPQTLSKAGETYYLADDLSSRGSCLIVAADRVTIDFKDHSITGDGSGVAVGDRGVARALTTVKRGTGDSFETGIDLAASSRSAVLNMSANNNAGDGIIVGTRGMVKACMVGFNGGDGVVVGSSSQVQECLLYSNGEYGLVAGDRSLVTRNLVQSNTNGMIVAKFSNVTGNLAADNAGDGIHVGSGSQVNGNTATENTGVGIWVECPGMVTRNESWNNATNYSDLTGCRVSLNQ